MAIRNKEYSPGKIYFVTFTVYEWIPVFTERKYCELIFKWFEYMKVNYKNKVHSYVIMPNHFHGIIYFSEESPSVSKVIQNAKRFLAYELVRLLKEEGKEETLKRFERGARTDKGAIHKVFEDRYDSKMLDNPEIYLQKLNYIHNNPCQEHWRLSNLPENYAYSSASNYLGGKGIYDVDIIYYLVIILLARRSPFGRL